MISLKISHGKSFSLRKKIFRSTRFCFYFIFTLNNVLFCCITCFQNPLSTSSFPLPLPTAHRHLVTPITTYLQVTISSNRRAMSQQDDSTGRNSVDPRISIASEGFGLGRIHGHSGPPNLCARPIQPEENQGEMGMYKSLI